MSEYLEWKQDGGAVVRVHRRVPAGMERERVADFRGILLGTISSPDGEVNVEDYEILPPGVDFDPRTGTIAGQSRPSLGAVGYFRVTTETDPRLSDSDGAAFDRDFPSPLNVLLLFQRVDGTMQWADIYVQSGAGKQRHGALLPDEKYGDKTAAEPVAVRTWRPYLWPAIAAAVCAIIVGAAYLAADHDVRQNAARAQTVHPPLADWKPAPAPATAAPTPAAEPPPVSAADRTAAPPANKAEVRQQIRSLLDQWRDALLREDVTTYASLYAPSVGPYFRDNRVSRGQVADEVRRSLGRYGPVTSFKISDVTIAPVDENHAIANFRKDWRTARDAFSGAEKAQLRFEREDGKWFITSEQEIRVYWSRKR